LFIIDLRADLRGEVFLKYSSGLIVASWRGSDGNPQNKRLDTRWTSVALPTLYFYFRSDTAPPYHLMISSLNANSGSVAPADSTLPAADADKFSKLNDSYDKIVEDIYK
jgi:hypothetical protein